MSRSPRIPTLSARLALPLVVELDRRGARTDEVLARVGLERARLGLLVGRVPLDLWTELCRRGADACGDPGFALDAALNIDRSAFPLEFYLVSSQLDVLRGMEFAAPFVGSVVDGFETRVEMTHAGASAHFLLDGETLGPPLFAEYFLATLWGFVRSIVPSSPPARAVTFTHEQALHGRALDTVFDTQVRFGQAHVGFTFDVANVQIPIPGADPELGRLLAAQALSLVRANADIALKSRVRHWLSGHLSEGGAVGQRVAEALRMSERSLRRRLSEEGTSMRELVDEARHEQALRLMAARPHNVEAVAAELGFATGSAFARAFRRWTGRSPTEHQRDDEHGPPDT
ncbi:MAG: AraC family transcriptional regulator ligand-binding domain-containing protein [Polyangiales bacterium]|nr:AraC family transcriptional regulator ligand-binding domain-containing protein [Myxococcales bacterium]MCB9661933.1 AraC family transcriptional regulator ligand-binding domain-containing protein [Sandaracinaceae bacterium]